MTTNYIAAAKPIMAGMLLEGRGNYQYHALRHDGSAACSSYLYIGSTGPAYKIMPKNRCRSRACQKLFAEADIAAAREVPNG